MSTTTSVQLTELPISSPISRPAIANPKRSQRDAILQESLAADSEAPDGGYGWVIVGCGGVLLWWSLGTTYAWGILQRALVEDGLASSAVLSFVGSLQAALIAALALVNSRLMRRVGARNTAMIGTVLMGGSELLAGFSTKNVGGLFVTFGVIMGTGVR